MHVIYSVIILQITMFQKEKANRKRERAKVRRIERRKLFATDAGRGRKRGGQEGNWRQW